jgi:hypothetical protein
MRTCAAPAAQAPSFLAGKRRRDRGICSERPSCSPPGWRKPANHPTAAVPEPIADRPPSTDTVEKLALRLAAILESRCPLDCCLLRYQAVARYDVSLVHRPPTFSTVSTQTGHPRCNRQRSRMRWRMRPGSQSGRRSGVIQHHSPAADPTGKARGAEGSAGNRRRVRWSSW